MWWLVFFKLWRYEQLCGTFIAPFCWYWSCSFGFITGCVRRQLANVIFMTIYISINFSLKAFCNCAIGMWQQAIYYSIIPLTRGLSTFNQRSDHLCSLCKGVHTGLALAAILQTVAITTKDDISCVVKDAIWSHDHKLTCAAMAIDLRRVAFTYAQTACQKWNKTHVHYLISSFISRVISFAYSSEISAVQRRKLNGLKIN